MEDQKAKGEKLQNKFEFDSVYANNHHFETSVWDLKILFGELEQHSGTTEIDWHTAVTMPWMQAKIFAYYLRLNIAIHESGANGVIKVHPNVLPPKPTPLSEQDKKDPKGVALHEQIVRIHAEMFGE